MKLFLKTIVVLCVLILLALFVFLNVLAFTDLSISDDAKMMLIVDSLLLFSVNGISVFLLEEEGGGSDEVAQ